MKWLSQSAQQLQWSPRAWLILQWARETYWHTNFGKAFALIYYMIMGFWIHFQVLWVNSFLCEFNRRASLWRVTIATSIVNKSNKWFLKFGILFDSFKYCFHRFLVFVNEIGLYDSTFHTFNGLIRESLGF